MCNAANGTWSHAVIDCHMSKCVCALMDDNVVEHMMACGSDDAKLWLSTMQDTLSEKEFAMILFTLLAIWWARRKEKHEEIFQSPLSTY